MKFYKKLILSFLIVRLFVSTISYAEDDDDEIVSFEEFSQPRGEEEEINTELNEVTNSNDVEDSRPISPPKHITERENYKEKPKVAKEPEELVSQNNMEDDEEFTETEEKINKPKGYKEIISPEPGEEINQNSGYKDSVISFDEFVSTSEGEEQGNKDSTGDINRKNQILTDKKENLDKNNPDEHITKGKTKTGRIEECGGAEIIVLNKITAKSTKLTLKKGNSEYSGNIEVKLYKSVKNTDPYAPDNMILVKVTETKLDDDPKVIFQGWIFGSNNSLSAFEHPVYEIFAKKCL